MLIYQDMEDNIENPINLDNCNWQTKLNVLQDNEGNITTDNLHIENSLIVAKDKSYLKEKERIYFKQFYRVSYENFFKHNFIKNDNHYYEVIPTNLPRYFYVDIDYKAEKDQLFEPEIITKIEKDIIKYITKITKDLLSQTLKIKIELNNIVSLSSSYKEKISLHIIFKDLKFRNHKEFTNFIDHFINIKVSNSKRYDSEYKDLIDESVYKKNQQFRFINQSKLKNPDIKLKLLTKKIKIEDTFIGIYKKNEEKNFIVVKERSENRKKKTKEGIDFKKEKNNKNFKHEYPKESDYCNYENEYDIILDIVPNCDEYTQTKRDWERMGSILKGIYGDIKGLEKWKEWSSKCLIKYPQNLEKCQEKWYNIEKGEEYELRFINDKYYSEYEKFRKYWDCKLLDLDIQKFNNNITYKDLNQRYLGDLNEYISQYNITVLMSKTGTGKTQTIKKFLMENLRNGTYKSVLFISTRRAMANSLTADFKEVNPNWKNYLDIIKETRDYREQMILLNKCNFLTIQYESLHKLERTYDIVVYDEIESILYQMSSDTNTNIAKGFDSTKKNFNILYYRLLQTCKKAILCDANIGKRTQLLINYLNKPTIFIENKFNNLREDNYKAHFLGHYVAREGQNIKRWFIFDIIEKLRKNKNIFVVCASNMFSKLIEREILNMQVLNKEDILLYTSETNETQFNHELSNVNTIWNTKRLIITTSKITNGVDFNQEHFDEVMVYINNTSCVARDTLQTIRRIRHLKEKKINYIISHNYKPINYIIKFEELQKHLEDLNLYSKKYNDELFLKIYQLNNIEKHNHYKYSNITTRKLFEESGYNIIGGDNLRYKINTHHKNFEIDYPEYIEVNLIDTLIDREFITKEDYDKIILSIQNNEDTEKIDIKNGLKTHYINFIKKCYFRLKYDPLPYDIVSHIYKNNDLYEIFEKYNLENSKNFELEKIDYSIYNVEKKILLNEIHIIKKIYEILNIKSLFTNNKIIEIEEKDEDGEDETNYYFEISMIQAKKIDLYIQKEKKLIKDTYDIHYYNYKNVIQKIISCWSNGIYNVIKENQFKIENIDLINQLKGYIDLEEYKFK